MKRTCLLGAVLMAAGAGGTYAYLSLAKPSSARESGSGGGEVCGKHDLVLAECPFCTPAIVESEGLCVEHDVPEALCWICRPALAAAYRAEGDWCAGHGVPESRCERCRGGDLPEDERH